jgi:hypothetical protein
VRGLKSSSVLAAAVTILVAAEAWGQHSRALAANIAASGVDGTQGSIITIDGVLELGDEKKFIDLAPCQS